MAAGPPQQLGATAQQPTGGADEVVDVAAVIGDVVEPAHPGRGDPDLMMLLGCREEDQLVLQPVGDPEAEEIAVPRRQRIGCGRADE